METRRLVTLEERWLADVGFGDCFREPLRLDTREEQELGRDAYRIDLAGERLVLMRRSETGECKVQYRFGLEPHVYDDYARRVAIIRRQRTPTSRSDGSAPARWPTGE